MIVELQDIVRAAQRLEPVVHRTPVLRSRQIDALVGSELFFKCENLQRAGSFKIRGAYNKIAQIPEADRRRGVISYSSGNHAQGVALAAALLGAPATIAVPESIVPTKRSAAEGYGATLVVAGATSADRRAYAEQRAAEEGLTLIPPYDDAAIIAGQGTVSREFLEDVADLDMLVVPIGGGGLISGCAIAARALKPDVRIIGVEPLDADDTARSLAAGHPVRIPGPQTIADGLRSVEPGEITFGIIQQLVDEVVLVSDEEICGALLLLLERCKLLVEPSGAVGVAAALAGRLPTDAGRVGIVLSGGNIAPDLLAQILQQQSSGPFTSASS